MLVFSKFRIGGRLRLARGGFFLAMALAGGIGLCQAARLNVAVDLSRNSILRGVSLGTVAERTRPHRKAQDAAIIVTDDAAAAASLAKSRPGEIARAGACWMDYQRRIDVDTEQHGPAPAIDMAWEASLARDERLRSLFHAGCESLGPPHDRVVRDASERAFRRLSRPPGQRRHRHRSNSNDIQVPLAKETWPDAA